jgi:hypothetical protein
MLSSDQVTTIISHQTHWYHAYTTYKGAIDEQQLDACDRWTTIRNEKRGEAKK